jgi:hypothetical protein
MQTTMKPATIKPASFGSVSTATLRTEDLLSTFADELEWQIQRNGAFLSLPENFPMRDRLNAIHGDALDCFADDGETIAEDKEDDACELVNETLPDALSQFAPAYGYFGAHPGDGADFGYWVDVDSVKEQVGFVSSRRAEYPADDFSGEWLHVNDHGNCTLYVRENGNDREVWSIV